MYMALGGIPYYLKYVEPGLTANQNIQNIYFNASSPLKDEFKKLFSALFSQADAYMELVHIVATNRAGMTRSEIEKKAKLSTNGGGLTRRLQDLCQAGFFEQKTGWHRVRGEYYKLIDEFCLFQLDWVLPTKKRQLPRDYWLNASQEPQYRAWSGYAFEGVCMKHVHQIISAAQVQSAKLIDSWRFIPRQQDPEQQGVQIDRTDDAITLCEMKFTDEPFVIDKAYGQILNRKMNVFRSKTKTRKQLFWVIVSASGIKPSLYSEELISAVVIADDLFKKLPV